MKSSISRLAVAAIAFSLFGFSHAAGAQMLNQPFSFQRSGGSFGGSIGMSSAYRELMLERQLLGRSTRNNFIRGADGTLVNIERKGDQAFGRPALPAYVTSRSGFRLGFGAYAAGVGGTVALYTAGRQGGPSNEDMPAIQGGTAGSVPIDSWIMQLGSMPDLAS